MLTPESGKSISGVGKFDRLIRLPIPVIDSKIIYSVDEIDARQISCAFASHWWLMAIVKMFSQCIERSLEAIIELKVGNRWEFSS
jgi:hypothetical protein